MIASSSLPALRVALKTTRRFDEEDSVDVLIELFTRLRRIYALFFLGSLVIAFIPAEFLKGNFTLDGYLPAIYVILSVILEHAVTRMINYNDVQIVVSSPLSVISACIQFALLISFLLNLPLICYELYKFVEPGLYAHEKKALLQGMYGIGFLFVLGSAIAYFVVLPITMGVLTSISIPLVNSGQTPMVIFFTLDSIFTMVIWTVFSAGLLYTIPGVVYTLVVVEVIDVNYLVNNRKNVILAILIIAAVITPDPTIVSMVILSIPVIIIYEFIIYQGLKIKSTKHTSFFGGRFVVD